MSSRSCTKCGERKPLSDFYAMKGMRDGHRNDCIECNKAAKRARHAANPEPHRERAKQWAAYYRKAHGISLDEADAILQAQGHRCAICKDAMPERLGSMHLDHDHASGRIRGFLCIDCNHGLGKFKDEPDLLLRAVVYLREGGFTELLTA